MGFQESFPDMPFASLEEQLLDEALAMTPDARARWLERLARYAPALAARLEAVLFELEAADGFLPLRSRPGLVKRPDPGRAIGLRRATCGLRLAATRGRRGEDPRPGGRVLDAT